MNILEVNHITKRYSGSIALNNISLTVGENRILGLLGPNGAGKTSLIRIINQITAPDEGEICFKGEKLSIKHISQIAYLPEERGLYRKMKVGEQAVYLARLKGVDKKEAERRLHYWFEKFEISSWWNRQVEELSKGMQQKVQFIVTIIHEPSFFIFDEPFSGFDPINADLLKQEILNLKSKGASIIISTHDMSSVEELCDDIVLINNSEKILEGKIGDIKNKFKRNLFEVKYTGLSDDFDLETLPQDMFSVESQSESYGVCRAVLKLKAESSPNDLLLFLLPDMQLVSFREIMPTMKEIFISQVEKVRKGI